MATANRPVPGTDFDLVREFPLTQIKNGTHLARAQKFLDQLLRRNLDEGGQTYLKALSDLIEHYNPSTNP